ncbi:hypothetical protein B0O80DRAFT_429627 [Mortierella sp. GBAus27b]|nr:hypothetical protein B0O80DRAFT_429627 [Mortierella sp. GBAus27b]
MFNNLSQELLLLSMLSFTNNYVESWNNHPKVHFLKTQSGVRADRMVYLLSGVAVNYFKQVDFQAHIRVGKKTKGDILDILRQREVKGLLSSHSLPSQPSLFPSQPNVRTFTSYTSHFYLSHRALTTQRTTYLFGGELTK